MAARKRRRLIDRHHAVPHAPTKPEDAAQLARSRARWRACSRPGVRTAAQAPAHRAGTRGSPDAGARRAARLQDLEHARRRRAAPDFHRDVDDRHHRRRTGRGTAARIRLAHVGVGRAHGQLRRDRAPAAAIPAAGAGRQHHGRNPRSRRPQHVGKALQRSGRGARQLSQERISADRRGRAVQDRAGARRARAGDPAGRARARRGQPHAAHGSGAEGGPGARRTDAAHRIHVEPVADAPARRPRGDGGNLQQFRPSDRDALPHRARRRKPRKPPSASRR